MVCQIRIRAGRPAPPLPRPSCGENAQPKHFQPPEQTVRNGVLRPGCKHLVVGMGITRYRPWRMSQNQTEIYGNQDTRERRSSVLTLNCNSRARRTTAPARIQQFGALEKCDPPEQGNFHRVGNRVSRAKHNFRRPGRDSSGSRCNLRERRTYAAESSRKFRDA